jgi:hypothetical protein
LSNKHAERGDAVQARVNMAALQAFPLTMRRDSSARVMSLQNRVENDP